MQPRSSPRPSIRSGVVSRHKKIIAASIAFAIGIVSAWFVRKSVLYEHTEDAQIEGQIVPLSARVNGQLERVNVVEGQLVHAGDVLAVMDQKEYTIAVYKALASLADANATTAGLYFDAAITVNSAYGRLNAAQAAVKNANDQVAAMQNKLQADAAVLEQVQANFPRATFQEKQAALNLVLAVIAADQMEFRQAQEKLTQATTNLKSAQTAPQQVSLAKANAQVAESHILERKAQVDQAQLNLSNTIIRSPITGIVVKRRVERGQNVNIGQELIDVVSLDDVWITANFKEKQLSRIRSGQPVDIKVDAYGRTWKGHVTNLGACAKSAPGKQVKIASLVPVRIDFDRRNTQDFNADDLLKPGLSVETEVRVRWLPGSRTSNADGRSTVKLDGVKGGVLGLNVVCAETEREALRVQAPGELVRRLVGAGHLPDGVPSTDDAIDQLGRPPEPTRYVPGSWPRSIAAAPARLRELLEAMVAEV
jgi:membrane fusion protein (multidrug efflux system)